MGFTERFREDLLEPECLKTGEGGAYAQVQLLADVDGIRDVFVGLLQIGDGPRNRVVGDFAELGPVDDDIGLHGSANADYFVTDVLALSVV